MRELESLLTEKIKELAYPLSMILKRYMYVDTLTAVYLTIIISL